MDNMRFVSIYRFYKKRVFEFFLHLFWVFPIKRNRLVLLNECNFKYSDSPRCIADRLVSKDENVQIIFALKDMDDAHFVNNQIRTVRFASMKYFYYVMTAKVFLTNDGGISYIPFRKNQLVINTWHGGGAFKKIGCSINKEKMYKRDVELTAKKTDYFISSGAAFSKIVNEAYLISLDKILEFGLPRNDALRHISDESVTAIKQKLGISPNTKLVMYVPTFRNNGKNTFSNNTSPEMNIDVEGVLSVLQNKFKGEWKFAFRLHPSTEAKVVENEKVIDLSSYPDMQDLIIACDCLISDYSSVLWDYSITKKPAFLFAEDMLDYIKVTELYYPIQLWPFPKATNNVELIKNIVNFDADEYLKKCERYYMELGGTETGKATDSVCKLILDYMDKRKI